MLNKTKKNEIKKTQKNCFLTLLTIGSEVRVLLGSPLILVRQGELFSSFLLFENFKINEKYITDWTD